jgi:hypothetical protein
MAQKMHRVGAMAGGDAPIKQEKGRFWGGPGIEELNQFGA